MTHKFPISSHLFIFLYYHFPSLKLISFLYTIVIPSHNSRHLPTIPHPLPLSIPLSFTLHLFTSLSYCYRFPATIPMSLPITTLFSFSFTIPVFLSPCPFFSHHSRFPITIPSSLPVFLFPSEYFYFLFSLTIPHTILFSL